MLSMHQTCPSKFNLRINEDWTSRRRSAALGFGGALHAGLAAWYRWSKDEHELKPTRLERAINAIENSWPIEHPIDDFRSLGKCKDVMADYAYTYPSETFKVVGVDEGSPMVEQTFSLMTGLYLSCLTCGPEYNDDGTHNCPKCKAPLEPIEYGGIFDTLIDFTGQILILEHKSTSVLGASYFLQFRPNNQVTGYIWGARGLSGRRVVGTIVNAIGVYKSSQTKFERHITTRSEGDIAEWLKQVKAVAEEIQWHRRTGFWPMRTSACTLYGTCEFHNVHVLSTAIEREKRLESDYVKSKWDWEKRDENSAT